MPYADPAYARAARRARDRCRRGDQARRHVCAASGAGRDRASCTQRSRRCSSTPWHRPIASARTSTARTCSRSGGAAPYEREGRLAEPAGRACCRGRKARRSPSRRPCRWRLRGAAEVTSYAPAASRQASDDLLQRVQQLYAQDAQLHALWSAAMDARGMAAGPVAASQDPAELGQLAARFLARSRRSAHRHARDRAAGTRTARRRRAWRTSSRRSTRCSPRCATASARRGPTPRCWWPPSSAAPRRPTAPAAPITARRRWRCCSAAPCRAAACSADWPGLAAPALYQGRDLQPTTGLDALIATARRRVLRHRAGARRARVVSADRHSPAAADACCARLGLFRSELVGRRRPSRRSAGSRRWSSAPSLRWPRPCS